MGEIKRLDVGSWKGERREPEIVPFAVCREKTGGKLAETAGSGKVRVEVDVFESRFLIVDEKKT